MTSRDSTVWSYPGFTSLIIAVVAAFGAWGLLLPVIPQAILDQGGSAQTAGASTGIFMAATVISQTQSPRLLQRLGYRRTMMISGLLLGIPTLAHIIGLQFGLVAIVAAMRGVGFGVLTVTESALLAVLVPHRLLGKASGTLGAAVGVGELATLPSGILLAKAFGGYAPVYIIGAAVATAAVVFASRIPSPPVPVPQSTELGPNRVPTWRLVTIPAAAMCFTAMGFGGVSTFLSPAGQSLDPASGALWASIALGVVGCAQMVCRYVSGVYADAKGAGRLIVVSCAVATVGTGAIAAAIAIGLPLWTLLIGAAIYGAGFGAVQNEALLLMFGRLSKDRNTQASAIWNMSFDSGTGLGSFILGAVAVGSSPYVWIFGAATALVGAGFLATSADAIVGNHRVADKDNMRHVISRVIGAMHIRTLPRE